MSKREPPIIDMRIDGSFPPSRSASLPMRIAGVALAIAAFAAGLVVIGAILWVLLWMVMVLLPIAVIAGLIGWGAYKYQMWRNGGSFRRPPDFFRR
jgi:hypothetical protein